MGGGDEFLGRFGTARRIYGGRVGPGVQFVRGELQHHDKLGIIHELNLKNHVLFVLFLGN